MKPFEEAKLEVFKLDVEDVITVSGGGIGGSGAEGGAPSEDDDLG